MADDWPPAVNQHRNHPRKPQHLTFPTIPVTSEPFRTKRIKVFRTCRYSQATNTIWVTSHTSPANGSRAAPVLVRNTLGRSTAMGLLLEGPLQRSTFLKLRQRRPWRGLPIRTVGAVRFNATRNVIATDPMVTRLNAYTGGYAIFRLRGSVMRNGR